jgi:hypothetical protein
VELSWKIGCVNFRDCFDGNLTQLGKLEVWMARIVVAPGEQCDLLQADKGAYVNVLTLATNGTECRTKVVAAMSYYQFEVVDVEDVFPFSDSSNASETLRTIAEELEKSGNLKRVRFETLHKFPRVM